MARPYNLRNIARVHPTELLKLLKLQLFREAPWSLASLWKGHVIVLIFQKS